jgi:hypothetical protein
VKFGNGDFVLHTKYRKGTIKEKVLKRGEKGEKG